MKSRAEPDKALDGTWGVRAQSIAIAAALLAMVGCQSSSLDDAGSVRTWATTASAVAVFAEVYDPIAFADGHRTFEDPACPHTSDDGTTATLRGDCVDSSGATWTGSATVTRASDGNRTLTLDEFGHYQNADMRSTATGTAVVRRTGATAHEFDIDLEKNGGMTTKLHYQGRLEGDYGSPTVWSGTGRIERDGPLAPTGTIVATTVDERLDDAICSGQPVSGQTTIVTDDDYVVLSYDGATDCDATQSARWSLNGMDQGFVSGVACSMSSTRRGDPTAVISLLLFSLLGLRRRSPSQATTRR